MYSVSNSYKNTMSGSFIQSRVSGTITFPDNSQVTIDDSNIISGSLSINNKAVNNSDFGLGSVYVGEMDVTIYNTLIDRYSLYDARIDLSFFLTLGDNSEEEVPLGVFFVDTPKRTKKLISLKCYDAMVKFDRNVEEDSWGSPFALLTLACERCGVELQNTEAELLEFCNGDKDFSLNSERVGTYRDFLSAMSMMLGGYATINRFGKLEIRQFHQTPDLTVTATKRTSSTIEDYETFFRSIRARFIAEQNYYPYVEEDETMTTGLQMDLGDIPIVQGLETFKHEVLHNVLNVILGIRFVPCDFSMVSDPSIDLGDGLTLENVNNTTDDTFAIVTAYSWTYHKEEKITSNGADALLANVSDQKQKQIDSMEELIQSKNLVVKTYTNPDAINLVRGEETMVIRMSWSAFEDTTAIFFATIPVTMTHDGVLVLQIYRSVQHVGTLKTYLEKGQHFVTFTRYFPSSASEIVNLRVNAYFEYYESDSRKQNAKILSLKDWIDNQSITSTVDAVTGEVTSVFDYDYVDKPVDTTIPSGVIEAEDIKAVVFAQGLNATNAWDGTLELSDDIVPIGEFIFDVVRPSESIQTRFGSVTPYGMNEVIQAIGFDFGVDSFNDVLSVDEVITQQTVTFRGSGYTETVNGVLKLKTEYQYNSTPQTIDSGLMVSVQVMTTDKASVEGLVIE